ncbi:DUF637 domain-containing protein [Providencia hangzhouensis]|uniref:two-partner secretion domain-containing protein n=2 Tax=Providencia TaxID=586 RepID=UPI0034DD0A6F
MVEHKIPRLKRFIIYYLMCLFILFPINPSWGSNVLISGNDSSVYQKNSTTIVNIATPNENGISHNKYQQFNVLEKGIILNNSKNTVKTQLAGDINGNNRLREINAELIINEVVGNSQSQLLGKLEVAGKSANVIIANPNGITCNGCSFINVPALTLTTGKPFLGSDGQLSAIEVKKGTITIGNKGMNAETPNYTDIISQAMVLNGQIKGKNVSLMHGNNRIDFQKGTVTSINGEIQSPIIAIDTKALGGMYAGQIKLTSTASGIGVNLNNIYTTQGSLILTADGKITTNGNIQSKNEINVSGKELYIKKNAKLNAENDITLATNSLINKGEIIAGKDMRIFSNTIKNTGEKALVQAKENLWIQKNAIGDLSQSIVNKSATIKTEKGDLVVRAKEVANNRSLEGLYFTAQGSDDKKSVFSNDAVGKEFKNPIILNPIKEGITDDGVLYFLTHNYDVPAYDFRDWQNSYFVNSGISDPKRNLEFLNRLLGGTVPISSLPVINLGNYKYAYKTIGKTGDILAGKNLYISANELLNYGSNIKSKENMILTGRSFINSSLLVQNEHERYYRFTPNAMRNELTFTDSPAISNQFIDYSITGYRLPDETFALRQIDYPIYAPASIFAGNNFMSDFLEDVDFRYTSNDRISLGNGFVKGIINKPDYGNSKASKLYPSNRYSHLDYYDDKPFIVLPKDKEIIQDVPNIVTAKNVFIKGGNVKINHGLKSEQDVYIFSNTNIDLENAEIDTKHDFILSADKNIEVRKNSQVNANNAFIKSLQGSVLISNDSPERYYNKNGKAYEGNISVKNDILVQAKGNVIFLDSVIKPLNNFSVNAGENILFLENDINTPKIRVKELWDSEKYKTNFNNFLNNRGKIQTNKDLLLQAGGNLFSSGYGFYSNNNINFINGSELSIRPRFSSGEYDAVLTDTLDAYFLPEKANELTRVLSHSQIQKLIAPISAKKDLTMMSGEDMGIISANLSSGGNITLSAGKQLTLDSTSYSLTDFPTRNFYERKNLVTSIESVKDIVLSSAGDFVSRGAKLEAGKNITITSDNNIKFEALTEESRKNNTDKREQRRSEIHSGKNITLLSNGSTLFQATKLAAKGFIDIAAKGGILYAQSMIETTKWEEERKYCNRFLGIKSCFWGSTHEIKNFQSATNKVSEFVANKDINLFAKDDITLEATKLNTRHNAKITSQTGKVNFKAVKNSKFEQVISNSTGFYITHRDKGYKEDSWVLPSLHIGGALTVGAANGVSADVKAKNAQNLESVLNELGKRDETKWLASLKDRKDIQWDIVKDAYEQWDYESQHLNPVVSALIMISIAAMTHGTATEFAAWASSGSSGVTGGAISGAAYSGVMALSAQTANALVENKGDLTKTFNALGRSETVKSIITQMAVSGALSGLDVHMEWGAGTGAEAKLPLLSDGDWSNVAQRVAAQSVVSSSINTSIQGGSFTQNLKNAFLGNVANQLNAEGARLIGDNGQILGQSGKMLSHAAVSGLAAELSGNNTKGAVVGALAAEFAAIALDDNLIQAHEWKKKAEQKAQMAKAFGGFAGAIFTGEPGGVYSAANSAENTFRYNYLSHKQRELMEKELAAEPNLFKRAGIHIKWGLASSHQDGIFAAGFVAGVPAELWDTLKDVVNGTINYEETWDGIRALLTSETMFSDIAEGEKQDILNRINKIEIEYQKAGADGAFNAGLETGQLFTKVAGYIVTVKSAASISANSGRYVDALLNGKKSWPIIDIKEIYRIEPDGRKTYMAFGEGVYKQGYPFEDYIGKSRKLADSERLPAGTETFDYFTKNKEAISVKTLDTGAKIYQNPVKNSSKINGYINDVVNFKGIDQSRLTLLNSDIKLRTIEIAIPSKTTSEQWVEINKSIAYSIENNINMKITIVK